jgi:hypothetical protein
MAYRFDQSDNVGRKTFKEVHFERSEVFEDSISHMLE